MAAPEPDGSLQAIQAPARHLFGFLLVMLSLVVEGFDLQAANFAAPSIVAHFGISQPEIGPLLSASLFGLLFGALFIAPLGDRVGRRRLLIGCCMLYGLISLVTALAGSIAQIMALRFLVGVGLGAVLPNALALAGELVPAKLLATATGLVGIGITFGGAVAGATAALILPGFGWQGMFVTGGILPLAIALLLWVSLPESPALAHEPVRSGGVAQLFTAAERWKTLAIWLCFALVLMINYLMTGWIPLIVKDQGYSLSEAAWIATAGHGAGVIGGILASLALARGRWHVVALFAILAAICMAVLASRAWGAGMLTLLIALQGFFTVGTQNGLNGAAGATYPARQRALGLGWALGMGRIGSILGPLAGSAALLLGLGAARHFFTLPIIPLFVAALLALWLERASRAGSGSTQFNSERESTT